MPQSMDVQLIATMVVNGRAIWQKGKKVKSELAGQLPNELYDKVLWAMENEFGRLLKIERAKTKTSEPEKA